MNEDRRTGSKLWTIGLVAALHVALSACGGDEESRDRAVGDPDPELAGVWVGVLEAVEMGMPVSSEVWIELSADGVMQVIPELPAWPVRDGAWGVKEGMFVGQGTDEKLSRVRLTAPRSASQLSGTWQSGENTGPFLITKE